MSGEKRCAGCGGESEAGWAICPSDGIVRELIPDPEGSGLLVDDLSTPRYAVAPEEVSEWIECPSCPPLRILTTPSRRSPDSGRDRAKALEAEQVLSSLVEAIPEREPFYRLMVLVEAARQEAEQIATAGDDPAHDPEDLAW